VIFQTGFALALLVSLADLVILYIILRLIKPSAAKPDIKSETQLKINRMRSLIFRCSNDELRNKGELLSDTARRIFSLMNQKKIDETGGLEPGQLASYLENVNQLLEKYVSFLGVNQEKAKELDAPLLKLFDNGLSDFQDFYSDLQNDTLKEIKLKISITEETRKLDDYLRNNGVEEIPLDAGK
jgi:hypothetical protein